MAERNTEAPKGPALPVSVVGPIDVGRLIRELETIDDAREQATQDQ